MAINCIHINISRLLFYSNIRLLHVLLSCAINMYCVTMPLFLLQLNIPVSGPASLLPNPPGYLQPPFHPPFLIPPYTVVDGTVPEREKKECKNSRGEGGSNHALSYFLNDGDQSRGAGRREEGRIEVFEDRGRRVHSSPDRLILPSHWLGGPLAS